MKTRIIAFMGTGPGAGKTTASKALSSERTRTVSFATPVKDLAGCLGWDGVKDTKGRNLLEAIGMAGRAYHPDTWVYQWFDQAEDLLGQITHLLVDDCRFPNEVKKIKAMGGILVKISKPGTERPDLISENYMPEDDEFDFVIENEGTVEEFAAKVRKLLER